MYKYLILFVIIVGHLACQPNKEQTLLGKWKTESFKNTAMDAEIEKLKITMDTLTENNELARTMGLDSVKLMMQNMLDAFIENNEVMKDNMFLEFRKDKVCYLTSPEGVDSAKWYFEDNYIVIDEPELKKMGEVLRFEILKLEKNNLHIRMVDQGDTSLVQMIRTQ